ncbi:MAG TPA: hypothetical protein VFQ44_03430 [Streptosporangiaceae bacterium]|nr:hypothetical protein [Streptosporangiaceae bacterium]
MASMEEVARKYPWAVIDPSVLIGKKTPRSFEDLADDEIPLWRQFYLDWLIQTKGSQLPKNKAAHYISLLTKTARNRRESTKELQEFADQRRAEAKSELGTQGPLTEFYAVIREIKDAIEERAKESGKDASDAGIRFAAEAISSTFNASPDSNAPTDSERILGNGILHLLNGPSKQEYIRSIDEALQCFRRFCELTGNEGNGLRSIEDSIGRAHSLWQSWESALKEALGTYDETLDYLAASRKRRRQLRLDHPSRSERYDLAESGELHKELWALVSRYGQSMLGEWTTIANCYAALVRWATADAKRKMRQNFSAAFEEASAGLLAAKTAVGVVNGILAFFPPFGPAVAAGLYLCMTVADISLREFMIWQAGTDPDIVIKYLGQEFQRDIPESRRAEVIGDIAKYGLTTLEYLEKGAHVGEGFAEFGIAMSPLVTDVARESAENAFKIMSGSAPGGVPAAIGVMPVVGGVLTVGSLAFEWYEWSEDQKKHLQAAEHLTQTEVDDLQKMLKGAFDQQTSNAEWHNQLTEARLLMWNDDEFRVVIKGVRGTIDRTTYRFSPDDRTRAWRAMLTAARSKPAEFKYNNMPIRLDLSDPVGLTEAGGYLFCQVEGLCLDEPCFHEKFTFLIKISAEGIITVTGMDAPTYSDLVAAAVSAHGGQVSRQHELASLTFKVDWANAKVLSTSPWSFRCVAPGEVELFPAGKYAENTLWDVTIELPLKGMPYFISTSDAPVKPMVTVDTVRARLSEIYQAFYPNAARSVVQAYQLDWEGAEFGEFDRERGGYQIRMVLGYDYQTENWNALSNLWVQWDFARQVPHLDDANLTEVLNFGPEKAEELEKVFYAAVRQGSEHRATRRYKRRK